MNIVQLEDDIKSLPDENLITEMQNPTGGFPQYLVMSEIKRRKQMRDDYQGRMAAHQKTPPSPTMAEETVQQGIGTIMPSNMPQGTPPQGMPMAPQGMPMAPQGMPVNRPASIEGGGLESLMPQGMAGGGRTNRVMLGKKNYATDTFFSSQNPSFDPQGLGQAWEFFEKRYPPTEAEEAYAEAIRRYYDPERLKEREKFGKGMNLLRAGLAVGTARTPEQLSASMGPVIEGAVTQKSARDKEALARAAMEAELGKMESERQEKIGDLATKSLYTQAVISQSKREPEIIRIARDLARQNPDKFGGGRLPDIDKKGQKILDPQTGKPTFIQGRTGDYNDEAFNAASMALKSFAPGLKAGEAKSGYVKDRLEAEMVNILVEANDTNNYMSGEDKKSYTERRMAEKKKEFETEFDLYLAPHMGI